MNFLTRLRRCTRGSALVEFAILAPVFFMMLFGLIEWGRAYWTMQTLEEVAFNTARCMAVEADCATEQARRDFAVNRAADYSIAIQPGNVTASSGVTCRSQSGSHEVSITAGFSSPLSSFGIVPGTMTVQSCFPVFS